MSYKGGVRLRVVLRLCSLIAVLSAAALRFGWLWVRRMGRPSVHERALWASKTSRRMCRAFGLRITVTGDAPKRGLLASNHLGYLDLFLLSSFAPCIFVSKEEVRSWPLLGYLAVFAGTVFIRRGSARDGSALLAQVEEPLRAGALVVCFPEGTSTNGERVKPFHPLLFEAAIRAQCPIVPASVGYSSAAIAENQLAYWGDNTLVPHLLKSTDVDWIDAWVRFGEPLLEASDRKAAARTSHQWVAAARGDAEAS